MIRALFCFVALAVLGLPSAVYADDGTDSLFVNPEPDSKADTSQKVALDAFTGQTVRFFESLGVDGYLVAGRRADDSGEVTPGNALNFGFGTDVRLDKTARAFASFNLSYPTTTTTTSTNLYQPVQAPVTVSDSSQLTFSSINIKELFLDYALGNVAILRLGRQYATWGQGRIFNPGNLLEDINDGMAVKLSTALGPVAFTAAAVKNDGEYGVVANSQQALGLASVASAALAEYSGESYTVGLSGFYHAKIGEKADAYFKSSLLGTDFFLEGLGERGTDGQQSATGVAGIYRDFGEQQKWLKLQAEWLISGRGTTGSFTKVVNSDSSFKDQTFGIAATTELLSNIQTKPSVMWLQTLLDSSGQVVLGVVNSTLPHLDLTLAFTRVYGAADSRYILNNPDSAGRVWSFLFKASFNFSLNN